MSALQSDLRDGVRSLLRYPRVSIPALLTLAIAIGGNTATFTLVNSLLLSPLDFPAPERLVLVTESNPALGIERGAASGPRYADWEAQAGVFAHLAAFQTAQFNLAAGSAPRFVAGGFVTASLLPTLGVEPTVGRNFLREDDVPGAPAVVLISQGLWQREFGSDPGILGSDVRVDGVTARVVGVVPIDAHFPALRAELWRPLQLDPSRLNRNAHSLVAIARLADGVTLEAARSQMSAIASRLAEQYPDSDAGWTVRVDRLDQQFAAPLRPALYLLAAMVAAVLVIGCANVANLLLARGTLRETELAIRAASGATPAQIARQLLVECLLLALVGGALGVLLANWGLDLLLIQAARALSNPLISESGIAKTVGLDLRVLAFALVASVASAALFGLWPALQASRTDLHVVLKPGRGVVGQSRTRRQRVALTVVQVTLAITLLAGAGLAVRSLAAIQRIDPGFDPDGAVSVDVSLARATYPERSQQTAFFARLSERIDRIAGVEATALASELPLVGNMRLGYGLDSLPADINDLLVAGTVLISPDYLRVLRIPLLRGRAITPRDRAGAPAVILVNETLARRHWPDGDALGKRIAVGVSGGIAREVVGVVGNVSGSALEAADVPRIYLPYEQIQWGSTGRGLNPLLSRRVLVRTAGDPLAAVPELRRLLHELDPELALAGVRTMTDTVDQALSGRRWLAGSLAAFAAVALFLAAVGIYGVVYQTVRERRSEIGLRVVLGAEPRQVLALVLRQSMGAVGLGSALGVASALALGRLMRGLIYGVSAYDPATLAAVVAVLALVGLMASALPLGRALRIEPAEAIRSE